MFRSAESEESDEMSYGIMLADGVDVDVDVDDEARGVVADSDLTRPEDIT